MTSNEEWRPVVGYEGFYEVSSLGRVRSLDRMVYAGTGRKADGPHERLSKGRVLRLTTSDPYPKVGFKVNGAESRHYVHALVAAAFIGPRPANYDVCHNDGDRFNNAASNLRYDTRSENNRDIKRHGRRPYRTHCSEGHELSGDNMLEFGEVGTLSYRRRCAQCEQARSIRRRAS